ncbi:MAG: SdpI family protein [Candidatus Dojkabacteria bacterium]|jgi:uncharacterized membrane protein|nr:SdpI family protein [Candidatus Dojkabacteria bacterium]
MESNRKHFILPTILIVISILISTYFFPLLPESMASHWNASGVVDGYSSRLLNVILFPALQLFLLLLLIFLPKLDPKGENIKKFENKFYIFINALLLFFIILQLQVFLWNIDIQISMNSIMPILMGGLFLVMAYLIKNAKQNYTIGIRTPWTLHSEKVWNKTHKLGAKLFAISGLLSIISVVIPSYSYLVVIVTVLLSTLFLAIYSYLEYRKEILKRR